MCGNGSDFMLLISLHLLFSQEVATFALDRMQPRVVSFEEQIALVRESLAKVHEKEESWSTAAQVCRSFRSST